MSIHQRNAPASNPANGGDGSAVIEGLEALAAQYGNRFLLEPAPDHHLPEPGMGAIDRKRVKTNPGF